MTVEAPREGDQLTLTDAAAPAHRFADYSDAEVVRAELEVLGLDATPPHRELLRAAPGRPGRDADQGPARRCAGGTQSWWPA